MRLETTARLTWITTGPVPDTPFRATSRRRQARAGLEQPTPTLTWEKGYIALSTYLKQYKVGDIVDVVANGAVQKGSVTTNIQKDARRATY